MRIYCLLAIKLLTCVLASFDLRAAESDPAQRIPENEWLQIQRLPLRKKIGQLFIVGFKGQEFEEDLKTALLEIGPGGVILFGRNVSSARQVSNLTISAQKFALKNSRLPLFIATDQEGGDVIRIKTVPPLPSALAIGRSNDPSLAEAAGLATGRLLRSLGINMNLAPVLDVADPKQLAFIGTRTYGSDPDLVAKMATSFSEGLIRGGVMPTGKHFPGHGGTAEDSHFNTPTKTAALEELLRTDLLPFQRMQERFSNRWATMVAHVAYPALDPTLTPATFSRPIITSLLRGQMGFNGVIVTDDISMAGAKIKDTKERALRAIEAGADMIVVAWGLRTQRDLVDAVERAIRSGRIAASRLDESLYRIALAKRAFANPDLTPPQSERLQVALQNPTFRKLGDAIMAANFSRPEESDLTSFRSFAAGKPILVFSANERFSSTFRLRMSGSQVRTFKLDLERPYDVNRIMGSNPSAIGVFYVSGFQAARVAAKIDGDVARRILLVTVETQGTLKNATSFKLVSDVYYRHPDLGRMIADRYFMPTAETRSPAQAQSSTLKNDRDD